MIYLELYPVQMPEFELSVNGDVMTFDGEDFDFSSLPEGASLPAEAVSGEWFLQGSFITRTDGNLRATIKLPFGPNAPDETRFPAPITVTVDGPVTLPLYDIEPEPEETPV